MFFKPPPSICPICFAKKQFKFIMNYKSKDRKFSLYECFHCYTQFWMPFKNPGKNWYERQNKYRLYPPKLYRGYHKKFLSLYNFIPRDTKILDLGCGAGEFIAELQKKGVETWGVDSDSIDISIAKKYYGLKNVYAMSFDEFFLKNDLPQFDIITFFEVIEHLDNPLDFINKVKNLLKPGGIIFLSTPSRERMMANLYKWDFPPYHLSRWNKKAVEKLFSKIDFEIVFIDYTDEFLHFLDLTNRLSEKLNLNFFRKNRKVEQSLSDTNLRKQSPSDIQKIIISEFIDLLRKIKYITLNIIPARILWLFGKLGKFKNGVMIIKLERSKKRDEL